MMWCEHCGNAVEPHERNIYDIPDVNVAGYETTTIYYCPDCNHEVYQEPERCVMCGELVEPGEALCAACSEDIGAMVLLLAEYRKIEPEAIKDGLAEYLNREE